MPNPQPTDIVSVQVTLGLDTSHAAPPYNVDTCSITTVNRAGAEVTNSTWNLDEIGTPQQDGGGAAFTLKIIDTSQGVAGPALSVANWALTCIPRGNTSALSPFGNNVNTITGSGSAARSNGNSFALGLTNKIKSGIGDWDWSLMVQMVMGDGTIKCFGSDPEMKVDG